MNQLKRFTGKSLREIKSTTIRVPATSANMGPGFDTMGMALNIWNELTIEKNEIFEIVVEGEGSVELPKDTTNLVCIALTKAFKAAGKTVPSLKYTCKQIIPHSRGMGSSSAAIVSGILAGLVMSNHELPVKNTEHFLQIAANIEKHPDNVAPALYGGCQIGINTESERGWLSSRINLPQGLQCVLFVPNFHAPTKEARAVLPNNYTKEEVVKNLGAIATLVHSLNSKRFDKLKWGVRDTMHQPQRSSNFPHLYPCLRAAEEHGAFGTYLSGAGPTICALTHGTSGSWIAQKSTETNEKRIAVAMKKAAKDAGIEGKIYLTEPSYLGAQVIRTIPLVKEKEKCHRFTSNGPL